MHLLGAEVLVLVEELEKHKNQDRKEPDIKVGKRNWGMPQFLLGGHHEHFDLYPKGRGSYIISEAQ